ncbi:MAG: alpha/beta fold hydrolase [Chloroflexota bacterium]
MSASSSPWFVRSQLNPGAEARLFLFPHAGGGPSVFGKWLGKLPPHMEGYIAHYPGRGSRYPEPAIHYLPTLVEKLCEAIEPLLNKPFAFFGHSMGGLLAYELAQRLRGQNLPQALFISACGAPHLPDPHPPIHALPDSEFILSLQQLNSIPSELLDQPSVMQLFLPALRADSEAVETYHHIPGEPLDCPVIVFGGLEDPRVSRKHLEAWAAHTTSRFDTRYFPGDHFYLNAARDSIIEIIATELESSLHAKR